jgi:SAM-dependent methyltransferase
MDRDRHDAYSALQGNVLVCNLAGGIPFDNESVDAVFHSHLLEHLDRDIGRRFTTEVRRVLKPDGVHRVVVPDLEILCRRYLRHLDHCEEDPGKILEHESFIEAMIEQCVRREAHGSSLRRPLRRRIENALLGDARKRGQTHQWMYDRVSLSSLLASVGFRQISVRRCNESAIPNWASYGLEITASGEEHKPTSLYIEAIK